MKTEHENQNNENYPQKNQWRSKKNKPKTTLQNELSILKEAFEDQKNKHELEIQKERTKDIRKKWNRSWLKPGKKTEGEKNQTSRLNCKVSQKKMGEWKVSKGHKRKVAKEQR